jgi:hypothetical protein
VRVVRRRFACGSCPAAAVFSDFDRAGENMRMLLRFIGFTREADPTR